MTDSHLAAVNLDTGEIVDDDEDYQAASLGEHPALPRFEGQEVAYTTARVTSTANLPVGDHVFRMDDVVKLVIEARVQGVDHKIDPSGKLVRVHLLKAIDSLIVDWDLDMDGLREATA